MTPPVVSVIVPFRNGEADLPNLVRALRQQTLPPDSYEVILVDDGSSDGGVAWLRAQAPAGWTVLSHAESRGSYAARNTGLAHARAAHLAFTDVDCRPREDWLERGLAALSASPRAAGRIQFDQHDTPSVVELVDMGRFFRQRQYVREGFAATANLFVRRSVFDAVGGFDDALRWGGDYAFGRKCLGAGIPIVYADDVIVDHRARATLGELLRKSDHVGFGAGQIARRGGSSIGAIVKRAADRLTLTRKRGLKERNIQVDGRMRSLLVTGVLALAMAATALGFARGFLLASRSDRRGRQVTKGLVASIVVLTAIAASRWALPSTDGLAIEHFSNGQLMGAPVLEGLSSEVSIDELIETWKGEPPPAYGARWSGYLIVAEDNAYVFSLTSDDGSALRIDGALLIDNRGDHLARTVTGRAVLDRGSHAVVVEYGQNGGDAVLEWLWGPEGSELEPVPSSVLSPYRLGPATMWAVDAVEAATVPALAAAGVLVVWVVFPPASRLRPARGEPAERQVDA